MRDAPSPRGRGARAGKGFPTGFPKSRDCLLRATFHGLRTRPSLKGSALLVTLTSTGLSSNISQVNCLPIPEDNATDPFLFLISKASDINNEGRELLKIRTKINDMVAEATGKTSEQVHDDIRRDFHLTAEKALDYGVVDKVLYKRSSAGAR